MKLENSKVKVIFRFLLIGIVVLSLIFGIVFSSIKTSKGVNFGSQYRGSYQAMVGVYDVNKNNKDEDENSLPNGDAKKAADVLQNKLSPFYDGSVTITIAGNSRLLVTVPRDSYNNNSQLFINAIQSTGGLFVFNSQYQDVMLDDTLMPKAGLEADIKSKSATSELLGEVNQVSMPIGGTNLPFLNFTLNNDYFKKMVAPDSNDGVSKGPRLLMVTDVATVLNTIRSYFLFSTPTNQDSYLNTYLQSILVPLSNVIGSGSGAQNNDASILRDFFSVNTWFKTDADSWIEKTGSLLDKDFFNPNNGTSALKKLLFPDNKVEHDFSFKYDISRYVYDSNAVGNDFDVDGKYGRTIKIEQKDFLVNDIFNTLTKNLLGNVLLEKDSSTNDNLAGIKSVFNLDLFNEYFIFNNNVLGVPAVFVSPPNIRSGVNQGTVAGNNFYVGTRNYTQAKKAAAQIGQTSSGLSFHVFSVVNLDAIIANAMFIASTIILSIILFIMALFMLFFYRLLGVFTIIIAAIIASLTMLMHVVFGIAVGPEIIAIMFILLAFVMDFSVVFFEAIKTNIYRDKRPIGSAFKISNRETLGLVIDVTLATLLPNIILFWIGIGFLKNFATITTMGIIFTFLFEIVIFRFLTFLLGRTSLFKKNTWLLPINTNLNYQGRFLNHYLIEFHRSRLENYSNSTHLSTRDLIQVKRGEERIKKLDFKNQKFLDRKQNIYEAKRQQKLDRWAKKQIKYRNRLEKQNKGYRIFEPFYKLRINRLDYLVKVNDAPRDKQTQIFNQRIAKINKNIGWIRWITVSLFVIISVLGLILGLSVGLNYSNYFGKGTQYYVYGRYVSETYDVLASPESLPGLENPGDDNRITVITRELRKIHDDAEREILNRHGIERGSEEAKQYRHEWEALGVSQAYKYLISNDYLAKIAPSVTGLTFRSPIYSWGADYSMIDPTTSSFIDQPWVSVTITNNLIPHNNAVKDAFQILALDSSGTTKPLPPKNDGGVLGTLLQPHTAIDQIKQIGIIFGILLAALLVYMLIRFKWTYYVALALSLTMIMTVTIASIFVFRIPFTIEALAGILGVLSFSLLTGVLFLGKGKSLIGSRDRELLNQSFAKEIELEAQKKGLRREHKKTITLFKQEQKKERESIDKTDANYLRLNKEMAIRHKQELIAFIRNQERELKIKIFEINRQIKIEAKNNIFLKEISNEVLRFGILRTIFLGTFYLAIAIVTAATLPSIGIMGFVLVIGIIATTLIMLTILLPFWVSLEGLRLRWRWGYKRFITTIKVSSEEQVIKGLND